jgi:hypothetical protein
MMFYVRGLGRYVDYVPQPHSPFRKIAGGYIKVHRFDCVSF